MFGHERKYARVVEEKANNEWLDNIYSPVDSIQGV
jgi:hypothetical protein